MMNVPAAWWLSEELQTRRVSWVPRAPLPPFEASDHDSETGAFLQVHTVPIWPVPLNASVRYWRGNAWSVTIPGLPFVTGGSSVKPEHCLTWFLDRWPALWQTRILAAHRDRGYTHIVLSWPDSRDGNGQSIAQYTSLARRVKSAGFFVHHMLTSKVYDPRDMNVFEYADVVSPVLDALLAKSALDSCCIGWELDLFNDPAKLPEIISWTRAQIGAIPLYVHFSPGRMSWQRPGLSTRDFWLENHWLTGLLWQADPQWSAGMMAARLNDVQVRFAELAKQGLHFDLVPWEILAARQFDGDVDEDRGDLRGYEVSLCTPGYPLSGFGNGARWADGTAI